MGGARPTFWPQAERFGAPAPGQPRRVGLIAVRGVPVARLFCRGAGLGGPAPGQPRRAELIAGAWGAGWGSGGARPFGCRLRGFLGAAGPGSVAFKGGRGGGRGGPGAARLTPWGRRRGEAMMSNDCWPKGGCPGFRRVERGRVASTEDLGSARRGREGSSSAVQEGCPRNAMLPWGGCGMMGSCFRCSSSSTSARMLPSVPRSAASAFCREQRERSRRRERARRRGRRCCAVVQRSGVQAAVRASCRRASAGGSGGGRGSE